ncbi:hypothetical protein [Streptomyces sp. cmx-18-6]|uniref:hypothetical protein n=1 Tax=Streptomyces sp. cmx-18-6 TaxID=2790930 RepID=UPI00397E92EF
MNEAQRPVLVLISSIAVICLVVFSPNALAVTAAWWAALVVAIVSLVLIFVIRRKGNR